MDTTRQITTQNIQDEKIRNYTDCFKAVGKKLQCEADGCSVILSDKSTAIRHFKHLHPELAQAVDKIKSQNRENEFKSVDIRVQMQPSDLWNAIIRLIIFNALPFSIVKSQGFRYLINPFIIGFKRAGLNCTVNIPHVRSQITDKANQIKDAITNEVKGKFVCLLLDINIAFWCNGKIRIRTIGMQTIKVSQTSRNLFDIIKGVLAKFEINLEQIFAVTTDNGKNLRKLSKLASQELSDRDDVVDVDLDLDADDYEETNEFEDDNLSGSNDADCGYTNDCDSDEIFDPEIFNEEYFRDLLSNVRDEFPATYKNLFTNISCAAHGLHLVVTIAIKNCFETALIIDKCRSLAKKFRTPKLRAVLKENGLKMALLDVNTRWSSLYNMVSI